MPDPAVYTLDPNNPEHNALFRSWQAAQQAGLSNPGPETNAAFVNLGNAFRNLLNIPSDVTNFQVSYAPTPFTVHSGAGIPTSIIPAGTSGVSAVPPFQGQAPNNVGDIFGPSSPPSRTHVFELPTRPMERHPIARIQQNALQSLQNFPVLSRKRPSPGLGGMVGMPGQYNEHFWNAWRL